MPLQIQYQPHDIYVLRFSGILKRSEFAAEQNALARQIDTGSKPRLLGAGVRRAPVNFFPPNELEQARSWLAE